MSDTEKLIPDREAFEWVEREHPNESFQEKYNLAQAHTLLRLAKPRNMDDLHRMAEAGTLGELIREHNRKPGR